MRVDFRSDTITKPTPGMLDAMFHAEVGDDVFGEDPSISLLEKTMAERFGMEAALWCASGTMSNQIAITCHTKPGDEVICEQESHVFFYEGGGIAFNAGCQSRTIAGDRGRISATQIAACINPEDVHRARTSLVCLENTSNRGGGSCYDIDEIKEIRTLCRDRGLALHLDGARLFNALIAKNESAANYGALFDSISVCFNKGLGCPAGSVLMGSVAFIREARRKRKVLGGGLRQAGFLAATALYALEHHVNRLADDHQHAQQIGSALAENTRVKRVLPVETNLVIFELNEPDLRPFLNDLREKDIHLLSISDKRLRMVTHLGISEEMIRYAVKTITEL